MNWMFWRKKDGCEANHNAKASRPRNLPDQIGQYLVVREKQDPDWVWNLKCILQPFQNRKHCFNFYVFSMAQVYKTGLAVKDFATLEAHPEQILYYGWFDKQTNQIELHKGAPEKAA